MTTAVCTTYMSTESAVSYLTGCSVSLTQARYQLSTVA